ncbi:hypothetical protein ACPB8Q_05115 [Methanocaldococcus indicus]|uniref:hypothetical protein n=1 Tax=Methanocaldococcus indicus TaxID=213231 RepID=UPI003C6D3F6B
MQVRTANNGRRTKMGGETIEKVKKLIKRYYLLREFEEMGYPQEEIKEVMDELVAMIEEVVNDASVSH